MPDAPGSPINKLQNIKELSSNFLHYSNNKENFTDLFTFPSFELAGASNVFGATKERSAAGGPLLANDPHFELSAPSLFYLARLQLENVEYWTSIPGTPIILMVGTKN